MKQSSTGSPQAVDAVDTTPALTPVVVIDGFLGSSDVDYWGPLEATLSSAPSLPISTGPGSEGKPTSVDAHCLQQQPSRPILVVRLGCASSLHDRACELFYQIMGGTVDYGAAHAHEHGHLRFGRTYQALYPEWSAERPLHFIGHSLGGNTILALQRLLEQRAFPDHPTASADLIRSVTALSAPLNGTPLVHAMGMRDGGEPGEVRSWSMGWCLGRLAHIYECVGLSFPYDFQLDHWQLRPRYPTTDLSLSGAYTCVSEWLRCWRRLGHSLWQSPIFDSADSLPSDATPAACTRHNAGWSMHPRTWYRSYAGYLTTEPASDLRSRAMRVLHRWTQPRAVAPPPVATTNAKPCRCSHSAKLAEWTDGVVPFASQWHPHCCCRLRCSHRVLPTSADRDADVHLPPLRSVWETVHMPGVNHTDVVPYAGTAPHCTAWQRVFDDYACWLRQIE